MKRPLPLCRNQFFIFFELIKKVFLCIVFLFTICFETSAQFCNDCSGSGTACNQPPTDNNPDLIASCAELQIIFIIDESGSIGSAASQVEAGVLAFLNALKCTEAEVAIIEFNYDARYVVNTYSEIDNAMIDGMTDYFNGTPYNGQTYNSNGGTNWQDAMMAADDLPVSDMVFFLRMAIPPITIPDLMGRDRMMIVVAEILLKFPRL